jgi:hypothetical protein
VYHWFCFYLFISDVLTAVSMESTVFRDAMPVWSHVSLLTFRRSILPPSSGKNSKDESSGQNLSTHG